MLEKSSLDSRAISEKTTDLAEIIEGIIRERDLRRERDNAKYSFGK